VLFCSAGVTGNLGSGTEAQDARRANVDTPKLMFRKTAPNIFAKLLSPTFVSWFSGSHSPPDIHS
jgi:hypothetical protein